MNQVTEKYQLEVGARVIDFHLTPANALNRPILFIFHGHGYNKEPAKFKNPNWNVVCPVDNFGLDGLGSWFLGEAGNLFWLDAMPKILESVRERCGRGQVFLWGSSMGGYASLLYANILKARMCYANIPQTVLLGSKYAENGMGKYFRYVLEDEASVYNDLKRKIVTRSSCKYFLCFNQLEGSDYFSEQALPFIAHLHSFRQPIYVEVRPQAAHGKNHTISESINLFKAYMS